MKTARKFLILTILLVILITLIFYIPESYEMVKVILGMLCLFVLFLFIRTFLNWRSNLKPEDIKEIETYEVT